MRRKYQSTLVVLTALGLISAFVTSRAHAQTQQPALEQSIFSQVNEYRRTLSKPALQLNSSLTSAARAYARQMAQMETTVMSHTLDGKNPAVRVREAGYNAGRSGVRENIAWNRGRSQPASDAVRMWRESVLHHSAMISESHNYTGVGVYRSTSGAFYFCQVFADSASVPSRPSLGAIAPTGANRPTSPGISLPDLLVGRFPSAGDLPDLAASNFQLGKQLAPATTVRPHEASAVIRNLGGGAASSVDYAVYSIDWAKRSVHQIKHSPLHPTPRNLAPGQSATVHFHVDVPTGAAITVFLKVDPHNRMTESNELNNHANSSAIVTAGTRR